MPGFGDDLATLTAELTRVEDPLGSLDETAWITSTRLVSPGPRWSGVDGLSARGPRRLRDVDAEHVGVERGPRGAGVRPLRLLPLAEGRGRPDRLSGRLGRDNGQVAGGDPGELPDGAPPVRPRGRMGPRLARRFRGRRPDAGGRVRASRIVEAVVHGLDLAAALNREYQPADAAVRATPRADLPVQCVGRHDLLRGTARRGRIRRAGPPGTVAAGPGAVQLVQHRHPGRRRNPRRLLIRRRGGVGKNPPHDRCPERTQLSEPDSTARAARACSRIAGTNCRAGAGSPDSISSTSSGVPT